MPFYLFSAIKKNEGCLWHWFAIAAVKEKGKNKFLVRILCSQTFHFCLLFTESPLTGWYRLPATEWSGVEWEVKKPIGNSGWSRDNSSCLAPVFTRLFYPPFLLRLTRDGEWEFTPSLNLHFCVKFTGRCSVWQRTFSKSFAHFRTEQCSLSAKSSSEFLPRHAFLLTVLFLNRTRWRRLKQLK